MTGRSPGQWPVALPSTVGLADDPDEMYVQRASEKALHEMVMHSIKHDLRQQPSAHCVQSAVRVWCARIVAAGDEIAETKRSTA